MNPDFKFGALGADHVAPAIAAAMAVVAVLLFWLPRRHVTPVFLAAAILIPMDQVLTVAGAHFMMLRVLILLGWIRLIITMLSPKARLVGHGLNPIDKAVILYVLVKVTAFTLLWQQWPAFVNQVGFLYTNLGTYFLLRLWIRDEEDVNRTIKTLAFVALTVAILMVFEATTGRSLYAALGGHREALLQDLQRRNEQVRAMAGFLHPILAGTFGATLVALFLGLWAQGRRYWVSAAIGSIAATAITLTSGSSTAISAFGSGVLLFCLWHWRSRMRVLRWVIVGLLVCLHLVMKAPVWALIGRIDLIGGSSGYHRYMLVDLFIRRFSDWWLLGVKTTSDWGWDMWDLSNQYVAIGEDAGLLALIAFIAILYMSFKYLARARRRSEADKTKALLLWALSSCLFSHCIGFFGITYFDQTIVSFYALLAMISTMAFSKKTVFSASDAVRTSTIDTRAEDWVPAVSIP